MRLNIRLFSSVKQRRPFFVSTPIFYVNAAPHIGHLYSAVLADAVQRFEKLIDPDINVLFSTGTDEHGTKIQRAAENAKLPPQVYCDTISKEYRDLFQEANVQYTDFVRTTEDRHKEAVRHFWNKLKQEDYIYKAKYSGWYSVNDETFVPESQIKEELRDGENVKVSLESGHRVEWTEEENYMFRLSAFKTHLQRWLQTDGVITPSKYQKQLQDMLEKEVYFPDISVSRPASRVHWAIRVPDDPDQSVYVWLDALVSYLTAVGFPDEDVIRRRGRAWPADVHVVGKDILKFHGIYWPAFLMACRLSPPRSLLCHGHWTADGVKMSKSRRNQIAPADCPVPLESLRYFMLREHTNHSDANYSETKLVNTINSELADTLGNLASRCTGSALNPRGELPPLRLADLTSLASLAHPASAPQGDTAQALLNAVEALPDTCRDYYSKYQFYKAVDAVIHVLHVANLFFESHRPWELRKRIDRQNELDVILHVTMETLRVCGIILQPIIPDMSNRLLNKLNVPEDCRTWSDCERISWKQEGVIYETKHLQSGKFVLFQRIYTDKKSHKKASV